MRPHLAQSLVFSTLLVACGSSDTQVGRESPFDAYVDELIDVLCKSGAECCGDDFSRSDCHTILTLIAERPRDGKYVFHQDLADQCIAAIRANGACTEEEPEACSLTVSGLIPPGEECRYNTECASPAPGIRGMCDERADGSFRCQEITPLGGACMGTCHEQGCSYPSETEFPAAFCYASLGTYCAASGTCEALVPQGGVCGQGEICTEGLQCDIRSLTCAPDPAVGATCDFDSDCAEEDFCNAGSCAAGLPTGSPCESYTQCASDLCENGVCGPIETTGFVCIFAG